MRPCEIWRPSSSIERKANGVAGRSRSRRLDAIHALGGDAAQEPLTNTIVDSGMPLDVRRRSLQLVTASARGVDRVLLLRQKGNFPEDLGGDLSFLLHNHADRRIRLLAEQELPTSPAPMARRFTMLKRFLHCRVTHHVAASCFITTRTPPAVRCHRVTGEGTLVGPDLASIGIKYGDKELLYHIQYPSGAINYNFVAHSFLLEDGRVLNGLVVARKDGQITLGIATGQLINFAADEVERERPQSVSLMPESLRRELDRATAFRLDRIPAHSAAR